jgi:hypothetical protein
MYRTVTGRHLLLCFTVMVMVTAIGSLGAASASASLPEFSSATYPTDFIMQTAKVTLDSSEVSANIVCELSGVAEGDITGPKTFTARFKFKGCKAKGVGGTVVCTTSGQEAGIIRSELLKGAPVYTNKTTKQVGLDFNISENGFVSTVAKFSCGGHSVTWSNGAIAPVTSLNKPAKTYSLNFAVGQGGIQTPAMFESEAGKLIRNVPEITWPSEVFFSAGGVTAATTLTASREVEVKG